MEEDINQMHFEEGKVPDYLKKIDEDPLNIAKTDLSYQKGGNHDSLV